MDVPTWDGCIYTSVYLGFQFQMGFYNYVQSQSFAEYLAQIDSTKWNPKPSPATRIVLSS